MNSGDDAMTAIEKAHTPEFRAAYSEVVEAAFEAVRVLRAEVLSESS